MLEHETPAASIALILFFGCQRNRTKTILKLDLSRLLRMLPQPRQRLRASIVRLCQPNVVPLIVRAYRAGPRVQEPVQLVLARGLHRVHEGRQERQEEGVRQTHEARVGRLEQARRDAAGVRVDEGEAGMARREVLCASSGIMHIDIEKSRHVH